MPPSTHPVARFGCLILGHRRPFPDGLQVELRRHRNDRDGDSARRVDNQRLEDPGRIHPELFRRFQAI
jgi:hypothetical protein